MSEVRFQLPVVPAAVAEARRRAAALEDLPEQAVVDAELMVSELVTNSILHAGLGPEDQIEVAFRRDEGRLRSSSTTATGSPASANTIPRPAARAAWG